MGSAVKAGSGAGRAVRDPRLALVIVAGGASLPATGQPQACAATGVLPTLNAAQSSNAETITAVAESLGAGDRVAQIALMTAYTESTLENLGPETDNDGSLGLFQQRVAAGWGTAAKSKTRRTPPPCSPAPAGCCGLAEHRPWTAAQDVQGSAVANGSNYQANWSRAGSLLAAITGLADGEDCGGENGAEPAGPASRFGLPTAMPSHPMPRRPRRWL